jgi:hypothetical protein
MEMHRTFRVILDHTNQAHRITEYSFAGFEKIGFSGSLTQNSCKHVL